MAMNGVPRTRYTAVIAEDHALMREGLRRILGDWGDWGDVEIVEEVGNGIDAIRAARMWRPSLITLDLAMPQSRGIDVFVEIARQSPASRVAVITGLASAGLVTDLTEAGAHGVFLKTGSTDVLSRGLRLVLEGGRFVAPEVMRLIEDRPRRADLTLRERQVLSLVAQGLSNAEIAERLCISPKTVDRHRGSMMAKLQVHSVSRLLSYALREGLLDGERLVNDD